MLAAFWAKIWREKSGFSNITSPTNLSSEVWWRPLRMGEITLALLPRATTSVQERSLLVDISIYVSGMLEMFFGDVEFGLKI
jgi:hypothetical protein